MKLIKFLWSIEWFLYWRAGEAAIEKRVKWRWRKKAMKEAKTTCWIWWIHAAWRNQTERGTKQQQLRGKSINFLFILSARHSAVKNKDKSWMVSLRSLPCSSSFHQIKFEWKGRESCGGRKEINQIHLLHSFMRMKMDWLTFLPLIKLISSAGKDNFYFSFVSLKKEGK